MSPMGVSHAVSAAVSDAGRTANFDIQVQTSDLLSTSTRGGKVYRKSCKMCRVLKFFLFNLIKAFHHRLLDTPIPLVAHPVSVQSRVAVSQALNFAAPTSLLHSLKI
ncbi:hypothetical protein V6N12_056520 [Hibiscus sabdariffa]|uniref:Uncharacterized protein n=1 Tax=Hibiscus sabdariffa TaxID=183260 RepID=A0ABR2CUJ4_9ROSI